MISCADAVRQLWEYVEKELSPANRHRVEEHLALCRRCCGELEFAEELRGFMANRPEVELPPAVLARLEGLLESLETEGAQ
jgi:anti-sigma factor RsiW